jgi:hypothetical protein
MHLLGRCSALGPGPGSLPRPSSSPSSRTWPCALLAPHLVPCGTAWHSGAPGVLRRGVGAPLGFILFLRRDKKIFEGSTITFLIPRTALRGFFAILTTHRRNFFSTLKGLLRPGALASIGLMECLACVDEIAELLYYAGCRLVAPSPHAAPTCPT